MVSPRTIRRGAGRAAPAASTCRHEVDRESAECGGQAAACGARPRRILELGAGDGTLLLRFARMQRPRWHGVELTLLDRVDLVSEQTHAGYRELGWQVNFLCADALEWAAHAAARSDETGTDETGTDDDRRDDGRRRYDLCFANLFLHHFEPAPLVLLLRAVAAATDAFVACEPRRSSNIARVGSRLIGLLGASEGHADGDAVKSVAAGFTDPGIVGGVEHTRRLEPCRISGAALQSLSRRGARDAPPARGRAARERE